MGIVPSTFKQATCTRLLLWFALLLLSPLRLMPMLLFCMEPMDTLALLVPTHMPMELTDMVDTVLVMPDTDMELTHMPMVDTDTHMPTELTTERDLLMPSQRLMLLSSTELMDMVVLVMPDMDMELTHMPMVDMDTHMPMVSMESKL